MNALHGVGDVLRALAGHWGVDAPLVLLLLPLAVLPLVATAFRRQGIPSVAALPADRLSTVLAATLRGLGVVALAALILGLAGLHRRAQEVRREGTGAHLMLLLDRSSSMDNSFADRAPSGAQEAKSVVAKRLLSDFIARRPRDRIGVAAFSTSPMPVLPLTDHHDAVAAAIAAIDRPGLAFTDVGRGLALALGAFADEPDETSRAVLLVSDGAALIDRRVQDSLRDAISRTPVHLYWLFLRSRGAKGIFDVPPPGEDTPQANPERHLHLFFQSLGVPYRPFEATSPEAVKDAIAEIDRQETRPITYLERVPRRDFARPAFAMAALAVALLTLAKLAERGVVRRVAAPVQAEAAPAMRRAA